MAEIDEFPGLVCVVVVVGIVTVGVLRFSCDDDADCLACAWHDLSACEYFARPLDVSDLGEDVSWEEACFLRGYFGGLDDGGGHESEEVFEAADDGVLTGWEGELFESCGW